MKQRKRLFLHKCLRCYKKFPNEFTFTLHLQRKHLKHKTYKNISKNENASFTENVKQQHVKSEAINLPELNIKVEKFTEETLKTFPSPSINVLNVDAHINNVGDTKSEESSSNRKTTCKICKKTLSKKYLRQHIFLIHSNAPRFRCDICKREFKNKHWFEIHKQKEHSGTSNLTCEYCNKQFKLSAYLRRHISLVHIDLPTVSCKLCSKEIKNKEYLYLHMRDVHTKYSRLPCELCGKKFKNKHTLGNHITMVHSKLTKLSCEVCNKGFKTRYLFTLHNKRIHTKNSKLSCEICQKEFYVDVNLRRHIISMHTNHPKVKCETCNKEFKNKQRLYTHNKDAHGIKVTCELCNKQLCNNSTLRRHLLKIHSNSPTLSSLIEKTRKAYKDAMKALVVTEYIKCENILEEYEGVNVKFENHVTTHHQEK